MASLYKKTGFLDDKIFMRKPSDESNRKNMVLCQSLCCFCQAAFGTHLEREMDLFGANTFYLKCALLLTCYNTYYKIETYF